jgi:uncharacterized protein (TIGR00255 family)
MVKDLRSVNGKGLDLRLRLPDWIDGLEAAVRTALSQSVGRGNVSLSLRVQRDSGEDGVQINAGGLQSALAALRAADAAARAAGLSLAPVTAADILQVKGVLDSGGDGDQSGLLLRALSADLAPLIADFTAMRRAEGGALAGVVRDQIDQIQTLTLAARQCAEARRPLAEAAFRANLARILSTAAEADPGRVAQELAILAVKSDVTEELDRLAAHVAAARALIDEGGAIGRKLDFLMQEFMREANTLCAKSGNVDLTRIGLDLKSTIDQMREQVQNVE